MLKKIKDTLRWSALYKVYKKTQSKIACIFFDNPSKNIVIIWVTWTDWKSSTSAILHKILNENIWKTALFTTVEQKFWDESKENLYKMTNVSAWKTQEFLKNAIENDCKYCVLEVSSHWIDQMRVWNIEFDVWVLTNISEEHLDYHKSIHNYANTKKELFQRVLRNKKWLSIGVFNKDDAIWKQRSEEMAFNKTFSYSINSTSEIRWENIKEFIDHTEFTLKYLTEEYKVNTKLLAWFNVNNILSAISASYALKVPFEKAIKSVESIERIDWRLNPYTDNRWVSYLIDYAHTPAWLDAVLRYLKKIKWDNKIISVFGAPWERDVDKRPKMWYTVSVNSDIMIITDDDPAKEDRMKILEDIRKWVKRTYWDDWWVMPDRELAIKLAYDIAEKWDIVLIAWKWHEQVQLTNIGTRQYSDLWTLKAVVEEQKGSLKAV